MAADYAVYVGRTGGDELSAVPGNLGHQITLRDRGDGTTEIRALSWWTDMEAVKGYAGDKPEQAQYYPEDDAYLLEKPEFVEHHVIVGGDLAGPRG
jgi:heme-degrading monooxygenase HmoA